MNTNSISEEMLRNLSRLANIDIQPAHTQSVLGHLNAVASMASQLEKVPLEKDHLELAPVYEPKDKK